MRGQVGFWDIGERYVRLSEARDPLEKLNAVVPWEVFRKPLPKGRPMPEPTAHANAKKSSVRAWVEHVFAHQKNRFGLIIRTIGLARAEAKLTLVNLVYNFDCLIFHERRNAMG